MVCWGFGDFFIQRSTRRIGSVESLFFIGLFGAIALFPFVISDLAIVFEPQNLALLVFLGILTFIVAMFNFEGLKIGKLSVIDVLLEVELPITVALSVFLLNETLSLEQLALVFLIFAGSFLISTRSFSISHLVSHYKKSRSTIWADSKAALSISHWSSTLEKGVAFALLAAIGMGLLNFVTGVASKGISPLVAIWAPFSVFAIISFLVIVFRKNVHQTFLHAWQFKKLVLAESVFDTAAWALFAIALFHGTISITTAITEAYPVIAVSLGILVNKEKIARHQFLGAAITLAAAVSLGFWFS